MSFDIKSKTPLVDKALREIMGLVSTDDKVIWNHTSVIQPIQHIQKKYSSSHMKTIQALKAKEKNEIDTPV